MFAEHPDELVEVDPENLACVRLWACQSDVLSKGVPFPPFGELPIVRDEYRALVVGIHRHFIVEGARMAGVGRSPAIVVGFDEDPDDASVHVIVQHESQCVGLRRHRASFLSSDLQIRSTEVGNAFRISAVEKPRWIYGTTALTGMRVPEKTGFLPWTRRRLSVWPSTLFDRGSSMDSQMRSRSSWRSKTWLKTR